MVVVKKLSVKKIKCKECKYAVILGDTVLCINKLKTYSAKIPHLTHPENECIIGAKGEPYKDVSAYYKILEIYLEIAQTISELTDIYKRLSDIIKSELPLGSYRVKNKVIVVKEYKKKILDTKKVKELLKENGILEDFLVEKEIRFIKVLDKKDLEKKRWKCG